VVLPTPAINPPYQLPAAFRDATPKWKQLPKMFISSEDAHAFLVSIFGGVEHLRPSHHLPERVILIVPSGR
jgi:hypothetical protein